MSVNLIKPGGRGFSCDITQESSAHSTLHPPYPGSCDLGVPVVGGCRAWEVSSRTCCDSGHWGPAGESCYLRFLQTSPWLQRWFDGGKAEIPLLPDFLRIIRSYQSLWSTEHPFWAPSLMAGVWGTVLGAIGEGGCWWGDRKSGTMTATLHCIISNRV